MLRTVAVLLVVALLALAPDQAWAGKWVRGARPDLLEQYKPHNGRFTCLDKSKTIDFARVNDDYCDCPDGSDEPGTSACPAGTFYCRNRGHEPKLLSASFVDDGICDCCDGTDELSGCENTCIEQNAALRKSLKKKVAEYKQALDVRAGYVKQAAEKRASMVARLGSIDADISAKQEEVKQLTEAKERVAAEQAEKAAQEAAKAPDTAEQPPADQAQQSAPDAPAADAQQGQEQQEQHDKHGKSLSDEPQEESAEERGRRIAAQWTHDPEAAGSTEPAANVNVGGSHDDASAPPGTQEGILGAAPSSWLSKTVKKVKALLGGEQNPAGDTFDYDDPTQHGFDHEHGDFHSMLERTPADAASDHVTAAQAQLTALQEEKARLQRQVTYDYGKDDAWLALVGQCVEAREPQYSYRSCLFDAAAQVDNNAGHETNLGTWKGFEQDYAEAVFHEGDYCQSAPRRSMRVKFECGLENRSWGASEPSTCVYQAAASSPAACSQEELAQHEAALEAVLKEEEDLRRTIAAEAAEREQGQLHDEL